MLHKTQRPGGNAEQGERAKQCQQQYGDQLEPGEVGSRAPTDSLRTKPPSGSTGIEVAQHEKGDDRNRQDHGNKRTNRDSQDEPHRVQFTAEPDVCDLFAATATVNHTNVIRSHDSSRPLPPRLRN